MDVLFQCASDASNSLIGGANLISKVYFPRLILPLAAIGVALVDFAVNFAMLIALMVWYRFVPSWQIVLLPVFVVIAIFASLGPGLWLTALNVKYRDIRYIIPFLVQFGLYVSPVGYSSNIVPEQWRLLYSLNPMVGVIDGFRWCILGGQSRLYLPGFLLSIVVDRFFPVARYSPVPKDGKQLRRLDLNRSDQRSMSDIVISVENLSKRYLIGHQSAQREQLYGAARHHRPRDAQFRAQGG